jgi:hypothetical protein
VMKKVNYYTLSFAKFLVISLREEVFARKVSLALSLFIEVHVYQVMVSERSCIHVYESMFVLSKILLLDFVSEPDSVDFFSLYCFSASNLKIMLS